MKSARRPWGSRIVEHLDGEEQTKQRLEIIFQTISGELAVADACRRLGISQARFFELRATMLQAAMTSLQPKPAGRPPQKIDPAQERIAQLEEQLEDLRIHLAAAQLREEIALAMPHLRLGNQQARKKTTRPGRNARSPETLSITRPPSKPSTGGSSDT